MTIPFAIPGMMPISAPKAERRAEVSPRGAIDVVIASRPTNNPVQTLQIRVLDISGRVLFIDDTQSRVVGSLANGIIDYHLQLDETVVKLPTGSTFLLVVVDNVEQPTMWLHREDDVLNDPLGGVTPTVGPVALPSQFGGQPLAAGVIDLCVSYTRAFVSVPRMVVATVTPDPASSQVIAITATVVSATDTEFAVHLSGAPNTGGYVLNWAAWL